MRGYLRKRSKSSWTITLTLGRKVDPKTGKSKVNQKTITVRGTKPEAEAKLAELLNQYNKGEYIEPSMLTTGEWLQRWIDVYVKNSRKKRLRTIETYESVVRRHLIPAFDKIPLQKLSAGHIQHYYNTSSLSSSTLHQHHNILHQALKVAVVNERLLNINPAELVVEKPVANRNLEMNVWDEVEVRKFLLAAREAGIQEETLYTLAIETGMRKGEICGLKWEDVDLVARRLAVKRTLLRASPEPILGPPKVGRSRAVAISAQTSGLLKKHRIKQNELKLSLGDGYVDQDFVFTKENGDPLQINNFGQRSFAKLIEEAGVKKIRFHDLRHTCATLLLSQEVNPKIVQERLGHSDISMTLNRYSHVTPTMQDKAAQLLGDVMEI
ncbi:MAG TPA: site-specific integrase [Natronincola sp.]|nr:site-specific integrase [Natronincola sp.]